MSCDHEGNRLFLRRSLAPHVVVIWCADCGALFIDNEWQLPHHASATTRTDPPPPPATVCTCDTWAPTGMGGTWRESCPIHDDDPRGARASE